MWAFESFPAKIVYTPERKHDPPDAPTYEVEVFGYLDKQLVTFREITYWIDVEVGPIQFLPIYEFERKFAKFRLVNQYEEEKGK